MTDKQVHDDSASDIQEVSTAAQHADVAKPQDESCANVTLSKSQRS